MRMVACFSATIMAVGIASWFATRTGLDAVVPLEAPTGHPLGADERADVSLSNPMFSVLMGFSDGSGMTVSESTATTLSAVYRAVSLVAGSIAQLPLRTLERADGQLGKRRVASLLDNPGGQRFTPAEWVELVVVHLLLHGNAYLQHIYGGAGQLVALHPVHPSQVVTEWDDSRPGGKVYKVTALNGDGTRTVKLDARTMTQIMGLSLDGLVGLSVVSQARLSLGTGLAGDKSANRMFRNGAMISGLVTPADGEDLDEDEARTAKDTINRVMTGPENAGDIPVMSRRLQFTPWQMNAVDAQFLQSRTFSVEEIARWFGVPPHLLALDGHTSNWGTGIQEQNRGLARYTLSPWTTLIQQRLTRILYSPSRFAEFDYSAFLQPSPEDEVRLLIEQVNAGLITPNEARAIRNMEPVAGGDALRIPAGAAVPSAAPAGPTDDEGSP